MELYQLRTFVMVADEGNLTRAAKKLHTSQPAVSAQVKALEEELGVSLFQRTPKGMILTTDGVKLRQRADQVLTSVAEMEREAETMRGVIDGELRIGINARPELLRVAELFSTMQVQHPNLRIHFLQAMSGEVEEKLEHGDLDCGFMFGQVKSSRLMTVELQELAMVIAGAPHLQDELSSAKPQELADFPWIMTPANCPFNEVAAAFFTKHAISPRQAALIDDETVIQAMVQSGAGLSLLLFDDVEATKDTQPLTVWNKEPIRLQLSLACLQRRKEEPAIKALFSVMDNIWPDNNC